MSAGQQGMPEADVVIRSRNEAARITETLRALFRQRDVNFAVFCVDSGSTDGTVEILASQPVALLRIPPASFTYGYALNRGAELGEAEFIVCLNADAEPADEHWLIELLGPLRSDATVAACYSRQIPRSGAHLTVLRDYAWSFGEHAPVCDPPFFSMVASAYRRALWREHRFWEGRGAGDDVEWARWAVQRGFRTVYVPTSAVIHSHNYTGFEHYQKLLREQRMHVTLFGPRRQWSPSSTVGRFASDVARDLVFAASVRGRWSDLPAAVWYRSMQAAGRLRGYAAAVAKPAEAPTDVRPACSAPSRS